MSQEPNRLRVMADECAETIKRLTHEMKDVVDPIELNGCAIIGS